MVLKRHFFLRIWLFCPFLEKYANGWTEKDWPQKRVLNGLNDKDAKKFLISVYIWAMLLQQNLIPN